MEQQYIRETISVLSTNVSDADKALSHEFNRIAWRALAQAERYLLFGPETARLSVTRTFLQSMAKLSTVDTQSQLEEHRVAFLNTLGRMTNVPHPVIDIPDTYTDAEEDDD
jgi:hypothetical protein